MSINVKPRTTPTTTMPHTSPPSIDTLAAFARYDSATVQNARALLDGYIDAQIDYTGPDLKEMLGNPDGSGIPVVGIALTSTWTPLHEPADEQRLMDRIDYMDSIAGCDVPVVVAMQDIDIPARRGAIIGDGMAFMMRALGAVGAVVDGNARDLPGIQRANFALWATGKVPGHGPFNLIEHGIPIKVADMIVYPGDILVCDGDGVTRVPPAIADDVLVKCAEVREKEGKSHKFFSNPKFTMDDWEAYKSNLG